MRGRSPYGVERGLWHGEPAASLRAPADRLARDVAAFRDAFPQDSDGWYDHVRPRITNGSDAAAQGEPACRRVRAAGGRDGRCGPSQRLPMLVVSPYAKANHVDHRLLEQASILRFIEDNWRTGRIGGASFGARAGTLAPCSTSTARRRAASSSTRGPEPSCASGGYARAGVFSSASPGRWSGTKR